MKKFLETKDAVYSIDSKGNIYVEKGDAKHILSIFDEHLYKLRLFKGIPILEIDGLRMHLVKDFENPLQYSREIVRKLRIKPEDRVLDTCMGLGYTAIAASKAKKVITVELNEPVKKLAEWNPWSKMLFLGKIEIKMGDVFEEVKQLKDKFFSVIIHDPPRFSNAPLLYSLKFYQELYRIARPGARIYHYVGSVGQAKGRKIAEEVEKRLKMAGFSVINYDKKLQGLVFRKSAKPLR